MKLCRDMSRIQSSWSPVTTWNKFRPFSDSAAPVFSFRIWHRSLTTKLSLLVTVAVLLVLLALGVYFDVFLRDIFLQVTSTRMQHAYQRLAYNLGQIELELRDSSAYIKSDERMIASVELINTYQDKANYNTFLIDEEKKTLALELLDRVKLSFNSDVVLYGKEGELIAYVSHDARGYQLGYLTYVASQPTVLARQEADPEYRPAQLPANGNVTLNHMSHRSLEDGGKGSVTTYVRWGDTLVIKGHQSVYERKSGRMLAHLELSRVLDGGYFTELSKDLDIQVRQSFTNEFPVEATFMQSNGGSPTVFQVNDKYVSVLKKDLVNGAVYYSVASDKSLSNAVVNVHRLRFLLMLTLVGICALLMTRRFLRRSLALPLRKLMDQIRCVEQGDYANTPLVLSGDELQEISVSVNHLASAVQERETSLERARKEEEYLSNHDSLTGLNNRRYFAQRLESALALAQRQRSQFAILFLDLDQFKLVNDTLGHGVGDALLVQVGERLKIGASSSDTLARIGGDEFNVLLENVSDAVGVEVSVSKYLNLFREPFRCGDHQISTTASIGVVLYPKDGEDSMLLLRNADLAVYKAKENGRNRYSYYSEDLSKRARLRADMTHELQEAIDAGDQFVLHYQPKVSSSTGLMVAAEALLRWKSPVFGNVSPMEFIPLAEETGQIIAIGDWVIGQGCRDMAVLQEAGIWLNHLSMNVSNIQLRNHKLLDTLLGAVKCSGLRASQIELEITEGHIADDTGQAIRFLHELRAQGFQLAIDDFGTGYSSMSYLQKLPFTRLKIDKSFVDGLPNDKDSVSITRAILGLAKTFGLAITAEGVERDDQFQFLQREQCDEIQGYYFAKPMPLFDLQEHYRRTNSQA
jgi:diguanylate cyclase (GGDEF)-like protein